MSTEFIWPVRVYYEDTDVGGVVYHANYLKYFERARSEWLNFLGIDQAALLADNIVFAVQKADVEYIQPARFNDELAVVSTLSAIKGASFCFGQKIFQRGSCQQVERQSLVCAANIQVVCLNLDLFKPCRIPAVVKEELQRVS